MTVISKLHILLDGDITGATKMFKQASRHAKQLGRDVTAAGKQMSVAFTAPILGVGALSASLADTQQQAERGVFAALRAGGQDAQKGLVGLKAFASGLQDITTVGDESTLTLTQTALSMGLTEQQSMRAARNAIGLSKAFRINEQSAIRYTAALEEGDSTMLNRYIPTLRNIKDDTKRAAEAQKILAQAFEIAREEAKTGLGPLRQLKNQIGDLLEGFGDRILEAINPMIQRVRQVVGALQKMSPATKDVVIGVALLVAAVGPALIVFGTLIKLLGVALAFGPPILTVFKGIAMAVLGIVSPIGLAVAAIGGLVTIGYLFRNELGAAFEWVRSLIVDRIVPNLVDVLNRFGEMADTIFGGIGAALKESLVFVLTFIKTALDKMLALGQKVAEALGFDTAPLQATRDAVTGIIDNMNKDIRGGFVGTGDFVAGVLTDMKDVGGQAFDKLGDAGQEVTDRFKADFAALKAQYGHLFDLPDIDLDILNVFDNVADKSKRTGKVIEDAMAGAGDSMADSVVDAAFEGESALDALANSAKQVLKEITAALVKKGLTSIGLGAFFGTGLATGGRLQAGVPTLVGERGAEIITSNRSATVMNAADSRGAMRGAGGVHQEFNFPLAFPPQLEAYIRNVAAPAGREAALDLVKVQRGRI